MAFAQLTYCESLRNIEVNLRDQAKRLYHMGFRCQTISRNTLSNANATRPWSIYADFAHHLIGLARPLYAKDPFGVGLDTAVYAFDTSSIDLCLSVFAWAPFRSSKAAIRLHTLLDLRGNIPSFIHIGGVVLQMIKQHLRIKVFFGTSKNAVKTQVWIAIYLYVLIAVAKKRLHLDHHSLYEILQILNLSMFETIPLNQLLTPPSADSNSDFELNQLDLL